MSLRYKMKRGFTLVELMIVVAIIGILAVLGTVGYRKFTASAKTAEAREAIGQIGKNAVAAYDREKLATDTLIADGTGADISQKFCASEAAKVPAATPKGQKWQTKKSDWEAGDAVTGFKCLKFVIDQPQYFAYGYTSTDNKVDFTATANGDLNGDGVESTFSLLGGVTDGRAKIAGTIAEVNPEE